MVDQDIKWQYLPFDRLTGGQVYDILHLRSEVFVIEQDCIYQDMDYMDQSADHLMGYGGDSLAAYARILPPETRFAETSIGRIITSPTYRRTGLGIELVSTAVEFCRQKYPDSAIRISAQCYLEEFYEKFGFQTDSDIYQEDGIDHQEMLLEFQPDFD